MSLNEMLATWPRERLVKELAQQAKDNAALRERVARLECEVFWLKVPAAPLVDDPAPPASPCWCHTCRPVTIFDSRMVLCPACGNKRCPRAKDHRHACTGSNEPGQPGSAYPGNWKLPRETPP